MAKKRKTRNVLTARPAQKVEMKTFFCLIWAVITNKKDTNGQFIKITFTLLISYLLNLFAFLLGIFSITGIGVTVYQVFILNWNLINWFTNIFAVAIMLMLCFIAFLFAIMLRGFANEIEHEEDKNYIVAVFSGVVSFVALVVAFVALVRG